MSPNMVKIANDMYYMLTFVFTLVGSLYGLGLVWYDLKKGPFSLVLTRILDL